MCLVGVVKMVRVTRVFISTDTVYFMKSIDTNVKYLEFEADFLEATHGKD